MPYTRMERFTSLPPVLQDVMEGWMGHPFILFGSDEIAKAADNHPSGGSFRSTIGMLDQLPEKLRSRIGYENAYGLYKLKK